MTIKILKPNILKLVGKKVVDVRGCATKYDKKLKNPKLQPVFILFEGGRLFLELEEQDYHSYHDCSSWSREIHVRVDAKRWQNIKKNKLDYPKVTVDIGGY